jgi:hypothetical protein
MDTSQRELIIASRSPRVGVGLDEASESSVTSVRVAQRTVSAQRG